MLTLNIITITYNPSLDELSQTFSSLVNSLNKVKGRFNFRVILKDALSNNHEGIVKLIQSVPLDIEIESKKDNGISDGWNQAISLVENGYILLLNSGDLLHENYFQSWLEIKSNNEYMEDDLIYCCDVNIIKNGLLHSRVIPKVGKDKFYFGLGYGHPGVIMSQTIYKNVGKFKTELKIAMDLDFLIRCTNLGYKAIKFDGKIYMEADGVSTKNFITTHKEVHSVLSNNNHNSFFSFFSQIIIISLRYFKCFLFYFRNVLRALKYISLLSYNILIRILLLFRQRRILKIIGLKIGKGSSIAFGVKFLGFNKVSIGKNTIINNGVTIDNRGDVIIGNNVSISRNVQILTGSHDIKSPFFDYVSGKVQIEDYTVIFTSAIILPNTVINEKTVISSGAIVNGIIPKSSIYFDRKNIVFIDRSNIRYNLDGNVFFTL